MSCNIIIVKIYGGSPGLGKSGMIWEILAVVNPSIMPNQINGDIVHGS